jgi:hypothetical protein
VFEVLSGLKTIDIVAFETTEIDLNGGYFVLTCKQVCSLGYQVRMNWWAQKACRIK